MSGLQCFVCGELVQGDPAYQEYHLNLCLDKQVSGAAASLHDSTKAGEPATSASGRVKKPERDSESTSNSSRGLQHTTSSDAVLARALAEQIDEEAALALSHADAEEFAASEGAATHQWGAPESMSGAGSSGAGCPLCGSSWNELGVGSAQGEREEHAVMCLDGEGWEDELDEDEDKGRAVAKGGFGGGKGKLQPRGKARFAWETAGKGEPAVKGTKGLVRVLQSLLSRSHSEGKIQMAFLASERTEHIQQNFVDKVWGCGYRNAQMLFASLRYLDQYRNLHGEPAAGRAPLTPVPTIKDLQNIIELAWDNGHDPPGAQHFNGKLIGSRKWIGTTEIYTAFTWLGIRARVVDFPKVKGSEGTHQALVKWIQNYFSTPSTSPVGSKRPLPSDADDSSASSSSSGNALQTLMASKGSAIKLTAKQPLYLQHQGHSRTVVGIDIGKGGEWLLLYDPGKQVSMTLSRAAASQPSPSIANAPLNPPPKRPKSLSPDLDDDTSSTGNALGLSSVAAKGEAAFWAQTPGFEQIWHGKSTSKNGVAGSGAAKGWGSTSTKSSSLDLSLYGKMLEPYRVSLKSLSRRDEYQIIYIEDGPALTQREKDARKVVRSTRIGGSAGRA